MRKAKAAPVPAFQPQLLLSWEKGVNAYRAIEFEPNQIIIQMKNGEAWEPVANPLPASWEHSCIVACTRAVRELAALKEAIKAPQEGNRKTRRTKMKLLRGKR